MDSRSEAVKVVVRCRPLNESEINGARDSVVNVNGSDVTIKSKAEGLKHFTFDQAYGSTSIQEDIYQGTAAQLVQAVLQGYNGTIFAYGQTGCGKTYTMEGSGTVPDKKGIITRAFEHIFAEIQKGVQDMDYLVRVSHLEIYMEEIRDLLAKDPKAKLELRESAERGVYVKGLREFVVKNAAEMAAVLEVGKKNRSVGATLMNQDSSRSHSIFTIVVETIGKTSTVDSCCASSTPSPMQAQQRGKGHVRVGKLNLVDLAGSERQSKTQASGNRLREATKINLSLSALGNVISALTEGHTQHIPYRDSKLTRLLQDSLGGNAKTVMIANVGPADYNYDETLSTLRYAARAKFIKNQPRVNEDPKDAMLREFQEEITRLKAQLAARKASKDLYLSEVDPGTGQVEHLRQAMREDILRQLQQAGSMEALQQARQAAERTAKQRLEAELAVKHASEEEQQRAAQALQQRKEELEQYMSQMEEEQQERLMLEQRIKAMESKVLRGGNNLLDKVEQLEAAAAKQEHKLQQQRVQQEEQERRIAELEEVSLMLEGKYSSKQEEISVKSKKLSRVQQALAAVQQESRQVAQDCQAEREKLLDDIRSLTKQIKLKDLVISAYVPQEYRQTIMSHCRWDSGQQRWAVDHIEWAGNLTRARREAEASLSGSEASGSSGEAAGVSESGSESFGNSVFHGNSDRLSNVFFSYKESPNRGNSAGASGGYLAGRPRTAVLQARQGSRPATALHRHWG